MLNHIVLMGRLTRDPELRYTQSQIPVASMRIAVDRDFNRGDERQTDFIDVVAWRHTAEFVSKYFHKGSMMVVSGRLQMRDWTDRDGNKRTSAEVVADNVYFGESSRRDNGDGGSYGGGNSYGNGGNYGGNSSYGSGGGYGGGYSNAGRGGSQQGGSGANYSGRSQAPQPQSDNSGSSFSAFDDDDEGELPF